jgi:hypothetical protein
MSPLLIVDVSLGLRKTHSIAELRSALESADIDIDISEDECDLLDSIYLPSKYLSEASCLISSLT